MKKASTATMGSAFTPAVSMTETVAVHLSRQGWTSVRPAVATVRPKKSNVSTASSTKLSSACPMLANTATGPRRASCVDGQSWNASRVSSIRRRAVRCSPRTRLSSSSRPGPSVRPSR